MVIIEMQRQIMNVLENRGHRCITMIEAFGVPFDPEEFRTLLTMIPCTQIMGTIHDLLLMDIIVRFLFDKPEDVVMMKISGVHKA